MLDWQVKDNEGEWKEHKFLPGNLPPADKYQTAILMVVLNGRLVEAVSLQSTGSSWIATK